MQSKEDKEFIKTYLLNNIRILREIYDGSINIHERLITQGSLIQAEKMLDDLFHEEPPAQQIENRISLN